MNEFIEILDAKTLEKTLRGRGAVSEAESLEREAHELLVRVAKRPSEFRELWPKIIEKTHRARELRNPPYTREQRDAIVEAVATLFRNRRRG